MLQLRQALQSGDLAGAQQAFQACGRSGPEGSIPQSGSISPRRPPAGFRRHRKCSPSQEPARRRTGAACPGQYLPSPGPHSPAGSTRTRARAHASGEGFWPGTDYRHQRDRLSLGRTSRVFSKCGPSPVAATPAELTSAAGVAVRRTVARRPKAHTANPVAAFSGIRWSPIYSPAVLKEKYGWGRVIQTAPPQGRSFVMSLAGGAL